MAIKNIKHKGLRRLYDKDDASGIDANMLTKLADRLAALEYSQRPEDMGSMPGWKLHPLKGDYAGFWSIWVSGNWRLVFRFEDGDAYDVDLIDYH